MQAEIQAIGEREDRTKEKLRLLEEKCAELTKKNRSIQQLQVSEAFAIISTNYCYGTFLFSV